MLYNLANDFEAQRAVTKFKQLLKDKKTIELREKRKKRTYSQNNYLHLILSWFALEYGETAEFVKQEMFKKLVNPNIFKSEYANRRTGEIREDWRSTSSLNTLEMTQAIERFRDYSSKEAGIYLPDPDDLNFLNEIEKQITNQNQYL